MPPKLKSEVRMLHRTVIMQSPLHDLELHSKKFYIPGTLTAMYLCTHALIQINPFTTEADII